jgi:hypothetical protein
MTEKNPLLNKLLDDKQKGKAISSEQSTPQIK